AVQAEGPDRTEEIVTGILNDMETET
ncbi:MAG: hypothetical protein QOD01_2887, partial [Actinomycetota bacterium]|nr:hypothetical protein [Actinomycetota bacterium]